MYNKLKRNKGYYRALRQNRKILNRRLKLLDLEIEQHLTADQQLTKTRKSLLAKINLIQNATIFSRFKYFFTGRLKSLTPIF